MDDCANFWNDSVDDAGVLLILNVKLNGSQLALCYFKGDVTNDINEI